MLKELISQGNFAIWPQISLMMFFLTFAGVLIWVWRKGSDNHYRYMAGMILDDVNADAAGRGTEQEFDHE